LQNSRARVARLELAPNASTRLDAHPHDYILVSNGSSRLRVEGSSSQFDLDMANDELQVIKGGWSHRLVNRSEKPAEVLLIEINQQIHPDHPTCGLNGSNCESVRFGKSDQGTYSESTLFETDTVRVLRAELGPGSTLSTHAHSGGHLIVPLHDADLETEAGPQAKNPADPNNLAFWQSDGPRALLNRGKSDASLLIVEVK